MLTNAVFTQVFGSGPEVVLVHGFGMHSVVWQFVGEKLAKDFKVTLVDLPGFGRSTTNMANYEIATVVAALLEVTPENAHWIGWSLGGLISTYIAIHHPERINKLIGVACSPRFIRDEQWPGMDTKLLLEFTEQLELDYEATIMRFLLLQFFGTTGYKQKLSWLEKNLFLYGKPKIEVLMGGLHLLKNLDLRKDLFNLKCKTMYLLGRLDALIPADISLTLNSGNFNMECVVLPKASHALFLSHENEFLNQVRKFLYEA